MATKPVKYGTNGYFRSLMATDGPNCDQRLPLLQKEVLSQTFIWWAIILSANMDCYWKLENGFKVYLFGC